jgi:uncharacterized protein YodC (DUF2158 family)
MAFEPGDVVMLKSGGHSMTVVTVEEEDIDCLWVGDDGQMFRQSIPAIALTVVEGIDLDETDEAEDEEAEDKDNEEDDEHEDEDEEDDDRFTRWAPLSDRVENHDRGAGEDHGIENRGVHVDGHPLDDQPRDEGAAEADTADQ